MNMNRRKFLGAAAVSPLAAKEMAAKAAEAAQMEDAGISPFSDTMYTGITAFDYDDDSDSVSRSIWDAIKELGVPEWKRDDLWDDARRSRTLDPDIASMKSVSLSGKMQMQWKRNYQTLINRAFEQQKMEKLKRDFFKMHPDVSEY